MGYRTRRHMMIVRPHERGHGFGASLNGRDLVGLLTVIAAVNAAGDGEEEDGGENDNASLAKTVESWIPFLLGGILFFAVAGWCAVNLYTASHRREEEDSTSKRDIPYKMGSININHNNKNSSAVVAQQISVDSGLGNTRARSGTGDISPDYSATEPGAAAVTRCSSLRSSSLRHGSLRAGSLRDSNFISGGPGIVGGGIGFGIETFEGGQLQGKKAPGETGDTYQNPLAKGSVVKGGKGGGADPGKHGNSKASFSTAGSGSDRDFASVGRNSSSGRSSENLPSPSNKKTSRLGRKGRQSQGAAVRPERDDSPPHLRPGIAQARRTNLISRDRSSSNYNTHNSGDVV